RRGGARDDVDPVLLGQVLSRLSHEFSRVIHDEPEEPGSGGMKLFRELILSASGKAAIVLGGGPSCPDDFSRVREAFPNAVKISANLHGFKLTDCDYIVSVDDELKQKRDAAGITAPF